MENRKHSTPPLCVVPCSVTLLNALCGFGAIMFALNDATHLAVYCLVVAALCDFFDGFLARILNATSGFGTELDSLADAISFCLAPAVVVYAALNGELPWASPLVLGLYVCAGLCRLARFNSMTTPSCTFTGLPTTLAALALVQIIVCDPAAHSYRVLLCVSVLALLMISTVPFPKVRITRHARIRQLARYGAYGAFIALSTHHNLPTIFIAALCWALYHVAQHSKFRLSGNNWRRFWRTI